MPIMYVCMNIILMLPIIVLFIDCRIVVLQSMLLQYSRPSNDGTTQVPPLTANESIGNVNTFGEDGESFYNHKENLICKQDILCILYVHVPLL